MSSFAARVRARLADRGHAADDAGTALILALLVVLVVGTLLAAVLEFTRAGLTIVPGQRNDRNTSNYIQGAVQGAINNIRGSSELGRDESVATNQDCPDFTPPVPAGVPGVSSDGPFLVTCTGLDAGAGTGEDAPRFAIHAVGTGAGEGIRQVGGNAELYVNGGIRSAGVVSVAGGAGNSLRVNGTITAHKGCTGKVSSTDLAIGLSQCDEPLGTLDDPPAYPPALASQGALTTLIGAATSPETGADPVPTCNSSTVEFQPGYYSETPVALLQQRLPTCGTKALHFNPGTYYFDYPGEWDLGTYKVIGGTFNSTTLGAPACKFSNSVKYAGAQFIFGGSSSVLTNSSSGGNAAGMEVCGPGKGETGFGSSQRIALYVLSAAANPFVTSPSETTATLKYAAAPTTDALPTATTMPFVTPAGATTIDTATTAVATMLDDKQIATLQYAPLTTGVAKGAAVSSVKVKVAHTLVGTKAALKLTWAGSSDTADIDVATKCAANVCDITDALAAHDVPWRALNQLSLAYVATTTGNAPWVATVDGLEYEVTYRAPALRATTCNTSACTFLKSVNNPNVFFHGTVYAPTAGFDVWIHNSGETLFDRGVIVRDIAMTMNASSKQTSSPFQVPAATTAGRLVLFQGFVNGKERVRACVRYVDEAPGVSGDLSAYAGWSLSVKRWLVIRDTTTTAAACA